MGDDAVTQLNVPKGLRRTAHQGQENWLRSAEQLLDLICGVFDVPDLGRASVLDVGCGTKLSKVLLEQDRPIGRYTGVDASVDVVDFLGANVTDPRFEYHHIDAHNERYNPSGTPLADFDALPVGDEPFDIITLFSVFTHLAPHDYTAMLRLLRRHVAPDGGLLFSLFVDDGGDAAIAATLERMLASNDPAEVAKAQSLIAAAAGEQSAASTGTPAPYVDEVPDDRLRIARYSREHALELVDGTGWRVEALHPPLGFIQHYMVCRPI